MKKKVWQLTIAIVVIVVLAGCNTGTDTEKDSDTLNRTDTGMVSRADNTRVDDTDRMVNTDSAWISEVLEENYAEIKMARQAQQKATNAEVKSLAQTLEKDHKMLVNEAKDLASKKNWTVPKQETADAKSKIEDTTYDDVKEYERNWLEMMEDKHENNIRKFENANANDADLKTWISKTLPKLRAHHDKIK